MVRPRRSRMWPVALACGWLATAALNGQTYRFRFYGSAEGLFNLGVVTLYQDRTGFIWAGTQNGAFRFDGQRWRHYGTESGLVGDYVLGFAETPDGSFFVASESHLYRRNGERFEALALPRGRPRGSQPMVVTSAGSLLVALSDGFYEVKPPRFELAPRYPAQSPRGVFLHQSSIWFGCGDQACRLDPPAALHRFGREDGLPADLYDAFLADQQGNIWARGRKTLARLKSGSNRFESAAAPAGIYSRLPTLMLDRRGRILAPAAGGLLVKDGKTDSLIQARNGLSGHEVTCALEDREGSLWLGLSGGGVARWIGRDVWESYITADGLESPIIWQLVADGQGGLFAATHKGVYHGRPGPRGVYAWQRQPWAGQEYVRAIARTPRGVLLAAPAPYGIVEVEPAANPGAPARVKKHGLESGLPAERVYGLYEDGRGTVWVGSAAGLYKRRRGAARFEHVVLNPARPHASVYYFRPARGGFWLSSSHGLYRSFEGNWLRWTAQEGLKDNWVSALAPQGEDALWISYHSAKGITRLLFDESGGPPKLLQAEHHPRPGGVSDLAYFLGFDARGRLWAGTDRGAAILDRGDWFAHDQSTGLIWNDCDAESFLAEPGGAVWVGTSGGLSRFQPESSTHKRAAPPVAVTAARLGETDLTRIDGAAGQPGEDSLQVQFAALSYEDEESVELRYRLTKEAGAPPPWNYTRDRQLHFVSLSPGAYTLEIAAKTRRSAWTTPPARLRFLVTPLWHQTQWFRFTAAAAGFLLLAAGFLWRTSYLKKRQLWLEQCVSERTRQLEAARERAEEASRLKSEFLANMSHEIRTPLNGVMGMTSLVLNSELTPEQREHLEDAHHCAASLMGLLNDILDLSRIEAGRMEIRRSPFRPLDIADQAMKTVALRAREKNLDLRTETSAALPDTLMGDGLRIQQILVNLLGNAVKFTERGSVVLRLDFEPAPAVLRIEVEDTGIGIDPSMLEAVFEPFRQADGSTSRRYRGSGLGLAIVKKLVAGMGGAVRVQSAPGEGSVFVVSLPAEPAPPATPPEQRGGPAPASTRTPRRLLLAEDNEVNKKLAVALLRKLGHQVDCAADGEEALEKMRASQYDLVLMDLQMPRLDGLEAARRWRRHEAKGNLERTPIVALTAHAMHRHEIESLAAGLDGYLTKPFHLDELDAMVNKHARRRAQSG